MLQTWRHRNLQIMLEKSHIPVWSTGLGMIMQRRSKNVGGNKWWSCMGSEPKMAGLHMKCAYVARRTRQDGQCMCNVTLWCVVATIAAVQRNKCYII
jgi:hypothetical protein